MSLIPHAGALRRPRRVSGADRVRAFLPLLGLVLGSALAAQEPDPAEAYGIYRPPDTAAATGAGETAAADSGGAAPRADAVAGKDTVATVLEDTSLTARLDVRRGGGIRREEYPDLRQTTALTGRYGVFLELMKAGPWGAALGESAPLTVLAPTDSAFAALPAVVLERLRGDSALRARWAAMLMLAGDRSLAELLEAGEVRTAGGTVLRVAPGPDGFPRAGDAGIIQPDVTARNGRLHGVDRVSLPGGPAGDATSAAP